MKHLTTKQLSDRWCMCSGTLRNWRAKGKGPKFVKIEGKILYQMSEVERWEANTDLVREGK